jgi:hypothetical protein
MKNKKSKVETKKTKLNKVISINNKKMLKQNKTTKLLNEKNYIIFLKYTSCSKLQNLHMVGGGWGGSTLPEQVTTAQSEE